MLSVYLAGTHGIPQRGSRGGQANQGPDSEGNCRQDEMIKPDCDWTGQPDKAHGQQQIRAAPHGGDRQDRREQACGQQGFKQSSTEL